MLVARSLVPCIMRMGPVIRRLRSLSRPLYRVRPWFLRDDVGREKNSTLEQFTASSNVSTHRFQVIISKGNYTFYLAVDGVIKLSRCIDRQVFDMRRGRMKQMYRGYIILYHSSDDWRRFIYPPGKTETIRRAGSSHASRRRSGFIAESKEPVLMTK
jgi:hypothetical protein